MNDILSRLVDKKPKPYLILLFGLFIAYCSLYPRLDGAYFTGKYLWAEDGDIFIGQSRTLGLSSIWTPYAGYIYVYPRLFAFIGSFFDLIYQSYILLIGWIFAFGLMMAVLLSRAYAIGLKSPYIFIMVVLISSQPNQGDVFFNITNSQWMLGTGLSVYLLTPSNKKPLIYEYVLLVITCLTGVYSILIAPLMIINEFINKNIKKNITLYVVLACAFVQAFVLLTSGQLIKRSIDRDLMDWIQSFAVFILFGKSAVQIPMTLDVVTATPENFLKFIESFLFLVVAFLFWVELVFALVHLSKQQTTNARTKLKVSFLLLGSAALIILAGFYKSRYNPFLAIVPGSGNRYSWIPYSLLFFTSLVASSEQKKILNLTVFGMAIICYTNFNKVVSPNYQFASYVNFSMYHDVAIPVHPQPSDPENNYAYHIYGIDPKRDPKSITQEFILDRNSITSHGMIIEQIENAIKVSPKMNPASLIFDKPIACHNASDIGIEIEMLRSNKGWIQLYWSQSKTFTKENSMRRYYSTGDIKAQFAFPASHNVYIRLDLLDQSHPPAEQGDAKINKITVYCLP